MSPSQPVDASKEDRGALHPSNHIDVERKLAWHLRADVNAGVHGKQKNFLGTDARIAEASNLGTEKVELGPGSNTAGLRQGPRKLLAIAADIDIFAHQHA